MLKIYTVSISLRLSESVQKRYSHEGLFVTQDAIRCSKTFRAAFAVSLQAKKRGVNCTRILRIFR